MCAAMVYMHLRCLRSQSSPCCRASASAIRRYVHLVMIVQSHACTYACAYSVCVRVCVRVLYVCVSVCVFVCVFECCACVLYVCMYVLQLVLCNKYY